MAIKTGRNGQVMWDPAGTTPVLLISLNAWTGDFKTEYEDVTCFGDVNRVYIPGMKDAGGHDRRLLQLGELAMFEAAEQETPGLLEADAEQHGADVLLDGAGLHGCAASTRVCGAEGVGHLESGGAVPARRAAC